ncbi:phosphopantetheine-binding protein [Nonomuraea angiospora]|uniref:phosphopantetheine-binding protein n=1 Tax=Nonomuraea angiospora TaxID=46172 RepID=UPI0029B3067B|nr:phosphopantetheine-binding protein [Nonomuraea angiospora]MDX3099605.1 phosphopantetheine-binding protein [Nonomuraea angiospora]
MRLGDKTTDDTLASLRAGLTYTGDAQFGSCVQQAACNVLEAQGLVGAANLIGLSWGFTYKAGADRLRGADRWLPAVARLSGLDVSRSRFESTETAFEAEQTALKDGAPVVAAVDSFDITSPYQGRTHLMHALILVEWGAEDVTVQDPMNRPRPTRMALETYRRTRASAVVPDFDMIVFRGSVERPYSAVDGLVTLHEDALSHRESGLADLDLFILATEEDQVRPDVADVAAERMYAHHLMATAAQGRPELAPLAAGMDVLARRWYFAHTIGIADGVPSSRRMAKILRDLREREVRLLDDLDDTLRAAGLTSAGVAAAARDVAAETSLDLAEFLASIFAEQTQISVDGLQVTDDLWAAGLTSLESVRVMMALEDELGIEFPPSMLSRSTFGSLGAIESAIDHLRSGSAAPMGE